MRLRRTSLMNSVALRHAGIMFSPPDENGASGGSQGNNQQQGSGQQGNSTQQGQQGNQTQNNSSEQFDPAAFWAKSDASGDGLPGNGSSAESKSGTSGDQNQKTPQQSLVESIQAYQPGEAFTKEIGDQIANGDLSGVNKSIQSLLQQNMQQTLQFAAQMMKLYGDKQQKDFSGLVDQRLGNRDNSAALSESFPSYKEPGMKPIIDGIYSKAMENTKGDRAAAINMTRHMLKFVGNAGGNDLGIPPVSHTDTGMTSSAKSLVDELLAGGN